MFQIFIGISARVLCRSVCVAILAMGSLTLAARSAHAVETTGGNITVNGDDTPDPSGISLAVYERLAEGLRDDDGNTFTLYRHRSLDVYRIHYTASADPDLLLRFRQLAQISPANSVTFLGVGVLAAASNSTAFGASALALGQESSAVGRGARATGEVSSAFGVGAGASGENSSAVGAFARARGTLSSAFGSGARADHTRSTAIGGNARTTADNQIVLGTSTNIYRLPGLTGSDDAPYFVSVGADGDLGARAFNRVVEVSSRNTQVDGRTQTLSRNNILAGGYTFVAEGLADDTGRFDLFQLNDAYFAHYTSGARIGNLAEVTTALNTLQTVFGDGARATGLRSSAFGVFANATALESSAFGAFARATAQNDTAVGRGAGATGGFSTALGAGARASGSQSIALGNGALAETGWDVALGYNARATGGSATALGHVARATGLSSTAVGRNAQATGTLSSAFGVSANAFASFSTAIGRGAVVGTGHDRSTAIGVGATTTAANQMVLGIAASGSGGTAIAATSYRLPGLSGDAGRFVTLAADGTLIATTATSGGEVNFVGQADFGAAVTGTLTLGGADTDNINIGVTGTSADGQTITLGRVAPSGGTATTYRLPGLSGDAGRFVTLAADGTLIATTAPSGGGTLPLSVENVIATPSLTDYTQVATGLTDGTDTFTLYRHTTNRTLHVVFAGDTETVASRDMFADIAPASQSGGGGVVSDDSATAFGNGAFATAQRSSAFGRSALASGSSSSAFGVLAWATGQSSSAFGNFAQATRQDSSAFGVAAQATGLDSSAFGANARATGQNSSAFGSRAQASGLSSLAFGLGARATGSSSSAFGLAARATGLRSTAIGYRAVADEDNLMVLGIAASESLTATTYRLPGLTGSDDAPYFVSVGAGGDLASTALSAAWPLSVENVIATPSLTDYTQVATGLTDGTDTFTLYRHNTNRTLHVVFADDTETVASRDMFADIAPASQSGGGGVVSDDSMDDTNRGKTAFGNGAFAIAHRASAFGSRALASGRFSSAFGDGARAEANNSSAFGAGAQATGLYSSAFGAFAEATGLSSTAFGDSASATGLSSLAFGEGARATGQFSSAFGDGARARSSFSTAIGAGARTTAANQIVLGIGASHAVSGTAIPASTYQLPGLAPATGDPLLVTIDTDGTLRTTTALSGGGTFDFATAIAGVTAIGGATATNTGSIAFGSGAMATGNNAVAIGHDAMATMQSSSAFGESAQATGFRSTAVGRGAQATMEGSSAFGAFARATGGFSSAFGAFAQATGLRSTAIGYNARTTAANQIVLGIAASGSEETAIAATSYRLPGLISTDGAGTHLVTVDAEGDLARTAYATLFGDTGSSAFENAFTREFGASVTSATLTAIGGATVGGTNSIAFGQGAMATGLSVDPATATTDRGSATAIGQGALATGYRSTAVGRDAQATKQDSSAFGESARATGIGSTAIGQGAGAEASNSSAFGARAQATEFATSAFGAGARADHRRSTAIGAGATTTAENQIVLGTGTTTAYQLPGLAPATGDPLLVTIDTDGNLRTTTAAGGGTLPLSVGTPGAEPADLTSAYTEVATGLTDGTDTFTLYRHTTNNTLHVVFAGDTETVASRGMFADIALASRSGGGGVVSDDSMDDTNRGKTAFGNGAFAIATRASAFGARALAVSNSSAFGAGAHASGVQSSAFGVFARATGQFSSAFGQNARATMQSSSAFGTSARATMQSSSAFGALAQATGGNSSAFGADAQATGLRSSAFGAATRATHTSSTAIGRGAVTTAANQIVLGTRVADVLVPGSVTTSYRLRGLTNDGAGTHLVTVDAEGDLARTAYATLFGDTGAFDTAFTREFDSRIVTATAFGTDVTGIVTLGGVTTPTVRIGGGGTDNIFIGSAGTSTGTQTITLGRAGTDYNLPGLPESGDSGDDRFVTVDASGNLGTTTAAGGGTFDFDTRFETSLADSANGNTVFETAFTREFGVAYDARFNTDFDTRFGTSFGPAFDTRFAALTSQEQEGSTFIVTTDSEGNLGTADFDTELARALEEVGVIAQERVNSGTPYCSQANHRLCQSSPTDDEWEVPSTQRSYVRRSSAGEFSTLNEEFDFDSAFRPAFTTAFTPAFDRAFRPAFDNAFQDVFQDAFDKAFDARLAGESSLGLERLRAEVRNELREGIAIGNALAGLRAEPGTQLSISGALGFHEGANSLAFQAAYRPKSSFLVSTSLSTGLETGTVSGNVSFSLGF